jgi:ubiquinone/menaquinone biosynthesis C-methylase UbiE
MKSNTAQGIGQPARYDSVALHYDRAMRPLERWLLARLRAKVFASLPEDARLLEVGAGTGANFGFYPRGTRAAASELSFEMLKLASGKESGAGVQLVRSCAEKLPFADASFDAAVATLVFCSVSSPRDAFLELRRVVRAGGTVMLLEHVRPDGIMGFLFDALNVLTVPLFDDHFNRRTADEARRAGLKVLSVERHALGIINVIRLNNNPESGV